MPWGAGSLGSAYDWEALSRAPLLAIRRGCVAEDTLSWVNTTASRMPAAPSIAFVHIPIPQVGSRGSKGPYRAHCQASPPV